MRKASSLPRKAKYAKTFAFKERARQICFRTLKKRTLVVR